MNNLTIKDKIYNIRGKQVMLDRDLAELYGVSTGHLNRAVKRNKERFPIDFCFILAKDEFKNLKCQNGITRSDKQADWGGRRSFPLAFTEQGVAMLSSILKSKKAAEVNVNIMRAFVAMRRFLINNKYLFEKFQQIDQKFVTYDKNFEEIFKKIEGKDLPEKGIFFDGQVFDAYKFITDLIKSAKERVILIDNYVDENTLSLFSDKKENVNVTIYTKNVSEKLNIAVNKFNKQYKGLELKRFDKSHDRFLIIDEELYHIGASLKDLGKKWFGFSKMNKKLIEIITKL